MRPRELTLRGFRSYRDEVTFDLRGRQLVGIVGPIGAGKSSILDGVAFALFGRTPRIHRETKSLIHQLADTAHVQLVFEVDGGTGRVTRALKRKGQGQAKLAHLEKDVPDAHVLETVVMDKPVRARVEQLLGMDFDTFGRSVLLAQNRFADFLLATDAPRNAVLKGVFGYERFDAALVVTRERVAREEATLAALDLEGTRLAEARAALAEARAVAETAVARRGRIEGIRPAVEDLDRDVVQANADHAGASREIERLTRAAQGLPVAHTLDGVLAEADGAAATVAEAEAGLVVAEDARARAEAGREALAASMGDLRVFADLVAQLHAQATAVGSAAAARAQAEAAVSDADRTLATAAATSEEAAASLTTAEEKIAEASAELQAADQGLHAARHLEMAAELRAGLTAGDPCPVCAQVVTAAPKGTKSPGIRRAERAHAAALKQHARATKERDAAAAAAANAAAAAAGATVDRARRAVVAAEAATTTHEAEATLAATQSSLVDRLGDGDPNELLDERQRELQHAEATAREAADAVRAARAELDRARQRAASATGALTRIREQLAGAWGALEDVPDTQSEVSPAATRTSYVEVTERIQVRTGEAARRHEDASRRIAAAATRRGELLGSIGLDADTDLVAARTEAEVHAAQAEERVRGLTATVQAGADLDRRGDAARERHALARRLREDLQPSRFLAWLLGEERAALADLGSTHLEELTDGDYRFSDDETFKIVDVNAGGAIRDPDSLSGGETFLASLALALALADMVTRGGGRLDSFFLDEGFGSLDPEHIERAMRGIEHLVHGGGDRLVVLVSHVEQMHELLEDLIVLDKDEIAGTSRVLSGATPL